MTERIRIEYEALFRIEMRHAFFLNRGDKEFEHLAPLQQQSILGSYDLREHVDIEPTPETLLLLRRHRLLFRRNAMGFSVYASLDGKKLKFPFARSEAFRFHVIARNRNFDDISNLKFSDPASSRIHLFSTDAANIDAEGAHLSQPLPGFRSNRDYPTGSQIVNNAADPTRRLTAVRNVALGSPRDANDWVDTAVLPSMTQNNVDNLDAGGQVIKDGFVYEALVDAPGIDESDATQWRRLFAPGIQAASTADSIELCGRFRTISLGNAEPTYVSVEIADSTGRIVRQTEFHGTPAHPLKVVTVDFGDQVGGVYRLMLKNRAGNFLKHNGNNLPQADQTVYFDGDAIQRNAFAILDVRTDSAAYELLDGNGDIRSPSYLLRITSPVTFWSYTFPKPLTDDERNQIGVPFQLADGPNDKIITQRARGIARGFVKLQRLNTGKLLPNPTEQTGIAIESDTGRLISPIYLSHKA